MEGRVKPQTKMEGDNMEGVCPIGNCFCPAGEKCQSAISTEEIDKTELSEICRDTEFPAEVVEERLRGRNVISISKKKGASKTGTEN